MSPDTAPTVLVTGGTRGVGRGIAQRFADAGYRVAVCARNEVELPDGWLFESGDLRDGEQAFALVDRVVERFGGRLDTLVNNAGGSPPAEAATASPRFTERIVALNLLSAIYCAQRANHWMQQQERGGAVVNIGSVCGTRPSLMTAAYGAAKAGLVNFTMTAAMEWAPKVRVNCISAGMVRTEVANDFYGDEEGIAKVGATVPIGRLAWPSEIGDVAVYLASDRASYVSGANVLVHGGGERPPLFDVG